MDSCGLAEYDEKDRHRRTREIGEILNKQGGLKGMQSAWHEVRGRVDTRDLERCWAGIGKWQG